MSFESAITIILTALAVMLAVVTIGIAALAIWGYIGLRDYLKEMADKRVDEAMTQALKKYPDAADMLKTMQRLRDQADFLDFRNVPDEPFQAACPRSNATSSPSSDSMCFPSVNSISFLAASKLGA
jgi:hypothetical protein